jgi:hypothetical protein
MRLQCAAVPVYARRFVLRRVRPVLRFRRVPLRLPRLLAPLRRLRRFGTFAPDLRASERPIAIACLRLVTFLPERPLRNVPRLRSRMTFSTFFDAFLLYFLAMDARSPFDYRRAQKAARTVPIPAPKPSCLLNRMPWANMIGASRLTGHGPVPSRHLSTAAHTRGRKP